MALADVQAHLTTITAAMDRAEIDTGCGRMQTGKAKPKIDPAAVYAARNTTK
jgi:hypothetical protein